MHLLAQSAVLKALGWSLLNSLWQMAFLWLVYVVFTHVFRRASSNVRHGLAVLLLGSGTVWTIITFINALLYTGAAMAGYRLSSVPETYVISSILRTGSQLISEALPWCSTLYLLTLLFLFARYGRQYFYTRKLACTCLSRPEANLRVFTEQTARQMGIKKEVKVWFSRLVESPVTLGSLKPVILIPLATACNLNTQQMEALILHELAHIRKQDYRLNLWIAVLEVLFFFNPFSRLLIRSIQKEREHRCDDVVLQFRYDPHTYVSALMTLAKTAHGSPGLALAAAGSSDCLLLQRVRRILKLHTTPEPLKSRSLLFLFFTLFVTCMALSRPALTIIKEHRDQPELANTSTPKGSDRTESSLSVIRFVAVDIPVKNRTETPAAKPHKNSSSGHAHNANGTYEENDQDVIIAETPSDDDEDNSVSVAGYASTVTAADKRDYSIAAHGATVNPNIDVNAGADAAPSGQACPLKAPSPYVPNSSFSYQRVQDSTLPGAQYVYMQQMASKQVEQAILKMQKELQWQLKVLQQSSSKDIPDLKQKQQIIIEQLKLQQQYLEKQLQLQKKLEKVGKKRVIVVI